MQTACVPNSNSPFIKHRLGGWMPSDPDNFRKWLKKTVQHVRDNHKVERAALHPSIQQFWKLIETNPDVRMQFSMMLEQVPLQYPYNVNPAGGPEFRSWEEMLLTFDYQLTKGPIWLYNTAGQQGLIGFPFNAFLDWPMGTPAGIYAMVRDDVNQCFRDMLNEYGRFLKSTASASVLSKNPDGWFSEQALTMMVKVAHPDAPPPPNPQPQFADIFVCDPTLPAYGFKSWDDFFIRKFRDGIRPVYQPQDLKTISNCCESGPYALVQGAKLRDKFWLKGQPYSLQDMLGGADYAQPFVNGTVYQAFLSALSYHCWHAPVSGRVKQIINIPGSYYAENYFEGFANVDGSGKPNPDPSAPNNSQGYICQVATRSVMIVTADNPAIGDMAIIVVGMAEVSTCEWYVQPGQHINKGDLIGAFHFGGSTHCLIFRPGVKLNFVPAATPPFPETESNLPVRGLLATVVS